MKKFLKIYGSKWSMRGEASGRLEVLFLFILFLVRSLAPLFLLVGFGLEYGHTVQALWA